VKDVIARGRVVEPELFAARSHVEPVGLKSVKRAPVRAEDFRVPGTGAATDVIGVVPGRIITEHLQFDMLVRDDEKHADPAQDVVKVAVVARHGKNRNIGRGFVKGFGLQRGALASSIGHDSHNICVVGADDGDMRRR
jgi:adenine deaminase